MKSFKVNRVAYLLTDFHTHTRYSPDSLTTLENLIAASRRKGLDRVVVTDHNTIKGGVRGAALAPELVIIGEEIETTEGEILAVYVSEEVKPGLPPMEAIAQLRAQGSFISISHPFDPTRKGGWRMEALLEIVPHIDAIETFNARTLVPWYNWRAERFAVEQGLPGTHGSDAHAAFELGRGALWVPAFEDAASLKENLPKAVSPRLTLSPPWVHLISRYAVWVKRRREKSGDQNNI
jgi:predicted metal-dependent phosphoesterase TrpH